jgi:hypothetical protein
MKRIPAFVRGMVTRAVESHCQREGIALITAEILDEMRARMPSRAGSMFSSKR